ncbi:atrial natriuretic peptide-converting enzyme [Schistocerca serialis cubense]|uniref:atrial natriuretic peptide-converting enzyme n=1 Tax=Schistocerca serialis cubense TaxID=2023355 RepID=UPI00214F019C|nr:atrial natriuretic peptide-converting enzyme [Schistocerca serialis cubense]
MTVTIEHKGKRKGSWDSKVSRSETPSSILSVDSDIRFTRKLGSQYRCGCCVVAAFLVLLLAAAVAVYFGYTLLASEGPAEQVFVCSMRVARGDAFQPPLADPASEAFRVRARSYRESLNMALRRSPLHSAFLGTEVLAFDGMESKDLVVHFNLHFDPYWMNIDVPLVVEALKQGVVNPESLYFSNYTIDPGSLEVKESTAALTSTTTPTTASLPVLPPSTTPAPPRRCAALELEYCSKMPYNRTSYPNIFGHKSIQEVRDNIIVFRELIDAECHRLAYDFVCQVLQPACVVRNLAYEEDKMILPCRNFCQDFWAGCGGRLSSFLQDALDCKMFPEFTGLGSCNLKPGCVQDLHSLGLSSRICDGVVDCTDMSDETDCSYCSKDLIHCGIGKACISADKVCDGKKDCPNGSDERHCLTVAPSLSVVETTLASTTHLSHYFSEGYLLLKEKGQTGKLCTENLNTTVPEPNRQATLNNIASSMCHRLSYQTVNTVRIEEDKEHSERYVYMQDPASADITFVPAPCPKREVLYIGCGDLDCGTQPARGTYGIDGLSKTAAHGDWPWHAALLKDGVHVCDGTLVSPLWVLTTTSCFQGQAKAQWTVRLGSIRLSASTPWQQEQPIVGMMKSPVEGSSVAMVKLAEAINMSDFVKPICLPNEGSTLLPYANTTYCNTLGWAKNREQLQRIEIKITPMDRCMNISFPTVNSVCTESFAKDCNEEEVAGSPMVCLSSDSKRWILMGLSNWRIACAASGMERPRLYDKITSNIDWIFKTMQTVT